MTDHVARHYSENLELAGLIKQRLRSAGKEVDKLTTADLAWNSSTIAIRQKRTQLQGSYSPPGQ
jgi:hypothetical protein